MPLAKTAADVIEEMKQIDLKSNAVTEKQVDEEGDCSAEGNCKSAALGEDIMKTEGAMQAQAGKREKVIVPHEAQVWFLEYAEYQKHKYGWPLSKSMRHAKELAPELFRDVHCDTPRRWQAQKQPRSEPGTSKVLSSVALTKLADIARATATAVPVSAPVYRIMFLEQLRDMKIECDLPLSWVASFLGKLNLSWGPAKAARGKKTWIQSRNPVRTCA